jgi:hypothetical protein
MVFRDLAAVMTRHIARWVTATTTAHRTTTGGKITGTALTKALTAARAASAPTPEADDDTTPDTSHAVDALEAALRVQKQVTAALAPAAVTQAMQHDPDRTRALLEELERQAMRA